MHSKEFNLYVISMFGHFIAIGMAVWYGMTCDTWEWLCGTAFIYSHDHNLC